MEILKEVKHDLSWSSPDGKFEATTINNTITSLAFCEPGKSESSECGKCINSTNYRFLKQVHTSLGELFEHIESEAKKAGHSFASDEKPNLHGIDILIDAKAKQEIGKSHPLIQNEA